MNDSIQRSPNEEMADGIAMSVLNNLKLYVDQKFEGLTELYQEANDIKINVTTLSTILHAKEIFSQEEFKDCAKEMKESFGLVKSDGTIDGEVTVTKYNF